MGPVIALVLAFMALSLFVKYAWEKVDLFLRSNYKYLILDSLASYIHYGKDIGVEASLVLDYPTNEVFERRLEGQRYLASKLGSGSGGGSGGGKARRGPALASSLVDCRFALAKVCMPLLRELEFSPDVSGRNFVTGVRHAVPRGGDDDDDPDDMSSSGMLHVVTEDGTARPYVGNDAVYTMGASCFYAPIQEEVNRRMIGVGGMPRFCPIAMNAELERNVELVKNLTGMDKVRYSLSGSEAIDGAIKDVRASCDDKPLVVRFKSAYHGHVSGVSFVDCPDHVFLPECSNSSIDFIERYHYRICAVIVNPMQHFTGVNRPSPPGEKVTHGSRIRKSIPREEYARWLHDLQEKCNYCTKYLTRVSYCMPDICPGSSSSRAASDPRDSSVVSLFPRLPRLRWSWTTFTSPSARPSY
jgi:hypothetical protein